MREPPDEGSQQGDGAAQVGRAERAARLLGAARDAVPAVKVTLPEIQAAIRARRYTAMYSTARLATVFAVVLCPMLALASVAVSRGWWVRHEAAPPTAISVPAGATMRVGRHGRFDLLLMGPTTIELAGDAAPIRLAAGQLVVSNEGRPLEVLTPGHRIEIVAVARVAVGVAAGGVVHVESLAGPAPRVDGSPHAEPSVSSGAHPAAPSPAPPDIAPPASAVAPSLVGVAQPRDNILAPSAPRARAAAVEATAPTPVAAASPPSAATAEISMVHDALEQLRGEKDGAGALRLLDEYDRRFPQGMLRDEADATRVEALLALGRTADALDRLEAMAPALLDRSSRLRVARGELRAARGRCQDALADFAAVASARSGGELARRIDRGRAACNSAAPRHTGERGGNQ
jgi:hypothetical protein